MNFLVVSFFNSHNIGDVLIAHQLCEDIKKIGNIQKYSYSGNPFEFTSLYDINDTSTDEKKTHKQRIYDLLSNRYLGFILSAYRKTPIIQNAIYLDYKNILKEIDVLVIGGGNMIFDVNEYSDSSHRFKVLVMLAKKMNIPVFATSIGIGPFYTKKQEKKAVKALEICDYITFRDNKSLEIYQNNTRNHKKAFLTVDPVFSMEKLVSKKSKKSNIIGVNIFNSQLIGDFGDDYQSLILGYTKLISRLIDVLDINIILFSTDTVDYPTIDTVYNELDANIKNRVRVENVNSLDDLIQIYSKIDILVGTRMHSMIVAYTQKIPIVGISWQPKIDSLFEMIDDTTSVFNYRTLIESIDKIINVVKNKSNDIEMEWGKIDRNILELQQKRLVNTEIIHKIINNKEKRNG